MSSVYGPELLKPPATEDNIDEAVGRRKKPDDAEFETDHDRAKRIRKERKVQKLRDADVNQKLMMNQAINDLLSSGGLSSATAGPNVGPAAGDFSAAGPAVGPSVGPALLGPALLGPAVVGPAVGPTLGPAVGPARGPAVGPTLGPVVGPSLSPAIGPSLGPAAGPGPAVGPALGPALGPAVGPMGPDGPPARAGAAPSRAKGPARPSPQDLAAASSGSTAALAAAATDSAELQVRVGHMDVFAAQKRMSWEELKMKLSEQSFREEGVPGSSTFDGYATKLEKERNEKLQIQEADTKKMLKQLNRGKNVKEKKQDPEAKAKGGESSSGEEGDSLLAWYKRPNE